MTEQDRFSLPLDDAPGPARPIGPQVANRLVQAALDEALPAAPPGQLRGPSPAPGARPGRRTLGIAAAAAVLLVGPLAAAAIYRIVRAPQAPAPAPQIERPRQAKPPAIAPVLEDPPAAPPPVRTPPSRRPKRKKMARRPARPAPQPPAPVVAPAPLSANALMAQASEHRRGRRWRDATRSYEAVFEKHPRNPAAYVARVAAATLRLEKLQDPKGAIRLFQAALSRRPGGPLSEEAREGLADAYRKLGAPQKEAAALRELLSKHPGAPSARAAKARLTELESR